MAKLNWTPQSKNDLISIAEFIAQDSQKYARIQIKRIRERTKKLTEFPLSGRVVPELENEKIREVIIGNYRIFYFLASDVQIDILTIHHSARKLKL